MGFEQLLGNHRLKENLIAGLAKGRLSHFYLISGPAGSGKHTLAKLLAAAILCQGESRPCGRCLPCRKVFAGSHPDFITVDDPEKKTVPVDLIRQARADMYVRPNEADKKIYLFPRAQDMGVPGQNALLKVLEEPPAYGVFILLTDNPEKILTTVRSRCTELSLSALPADILAQELQRQFPDADSALRSAAIVRSGGFLGQAIAYMEQGQTCTAQTEQFITSFAEKDVMGLLQVLVPMEKWKREVFIEEVSAWLQILHDALLHRSGARETGPLAKMLGDRRSARDLLDAIRQLQTAIEYAQGNVSVAAICGQLAWALR